MPCTLELPQYSVGSFHRACPEIYLYRFYILKAPESAARYFVLLHDYSYW